MGRSSGRYTYRPAATRRWRSPGARCSPAPAWLPRRSIRWWSPIGLARRDASLARRSGQARATCQVPAGEMSGLVGGNGAGKMTGMRVMMGVRGADAGAVGWAGVPLTFATRRHIGYMHEERGLYPKMRVVEQLVYLAELHGTPSDEARRNAARWLERLGLATRASDEVQALSQDRKSVV